MNTLKEIGFVVVWILFLTVNISAVDTMQFSGQAQPSNSKKVKEKCSLKEREVIVIFKEGVSYEKAVETVQKYGIEIKHYYKSISLHTNKPTMLLKSSLSTEKTLYLLKDEPLIESISSNYRRTIDTSPF